MLAHENFTYEATRTRLRVHGDLQDALREVENNPAITELDLGATDLNSINMERLKLWLENNESLRTLNLGIATVPLSTLEAIKRIVKSTFITKVDLNIDMTYPEGVYAERLNQLKEILKANREKTKSAVEAKSSQPELKRAVSEIKDIPSPDIDPISVATTSVTSTLKSNFSKLVDFFSWSAAPKPRSISITSQRISILEEKFSSLDIRVTEQDRKLEAFKKENKPLLDILDKRFGRLNRILNEDEVKHAEDFERKKLFEDGSLRNYYSKLLRQLTGTWMACMTISSGWVQNGKQFNSDHFANTLKSVGECFPGISVGTLIISTIIQTNNMITKNKLVATLNEFFDGFPKAIDTFTEVALELTKLQKQTIQSLKHRNKPGLKESTKQWMKKVKHLVTHDNGHKPETVMALANAAAILNAIMTGSVKTPTVEALVQLITDTKPSNNATNNPTSPSTRLISTSLDLYANYVSSDVKDSPNNTVQNEERVTNETRARGRTFYGDQVPLLSNDLQQSDAANEDSIKEESKVELSNLKFK